MRLLEQWRNGLDDARRSAVERGGRWSSQVRPQQRPGIGRWLGVAALGAAVGALGAHLLDPDRGRGRRARYADQLAAGARRGASRLDRGRRVVASRLVGVAEELKHAGNGQPMPNDAALTEKLETELFRDPSVPKGKININAEHGVVVLRGEVDTPEQQALLEERARRVPGVADVQNLLHLPNQPAPPEEPREHPASTVAGPPGDGQERLPG